MSVIGRHAPIAQGMHATRTRELMEKVIENDPIGLVLLLIHPHENYIPNFTIPVSGYVPNPVMKGHTPLSLASALGKEDVVYLLLSEKAPVNDWNAGGRTPVMCAAIAGLPGMVYSLRCCGADPSIGTPGGASIEPLVNRYVTEPEANGKVLQALSQPITAEDVQLGAEMIEDTWRKYYNLIS